MKALKRMCGLFFSFCMLVWMAVPVMAAEDSYTYQIRFLSGAQGTFDPGGNLSNNGTQSPKLESGECLLFDGMKPGDRVTFSNRMITLKDEGKYYVKGIRESGKDNNTVYFTNFTVEGDRDYVVAYGILGNSVAYTVHYEDASGNSLAPSETFYGNVGDRPVVSYLYIEGYQPQAYNLIGRLSENAEENNFTFVYSRAEAGTTTTTTTVRPGTTTVTTTDGETVTETETEVVTDDTAAADGTAAGGGTADAEETGEDNAAEEGGEPMEIVTVDDEEVPLANGSNIAVNNAKMPTDFAKLIAVPLSAKVGICSLLALIAGSTVRFFVLLGRKRKSNE